MAQTKEQNHAPAAANASGEKRPRTSRRPHYTRRPRRPQQPKEAATPIHIYPLGGLGEVGKNMTVYECCGDMIDPRGTDPHRGREELLQGPCKRRRERHSAGPGRLPLHR